MREQEELFEREERLKKKKAEGKGKPNMGFFLRYRGEKAKAYVGKRRTETGGLSTKKKKKDRTSPPGHHLCVSFPPPQQRHRQPPTIFLPCCNTVKKKKNSSIGCHNH
jgi:hypothetical protein